MKRCVSITVDIDPTEYHGAEDTPKGAIDLVIACLKNDTDMPDEVTVACQGVTKRVDLNK